MTGSSLIDLSSGCSITRSTGFRALLSSDSSQVLLAPHWPEQPIAHTDCTTLLQNVGFDAEHGRMRYVFMAFVSTCQRPVSIVNFLSGRLRAKLVTSELIRPQPTSMAPTQ